MKNKIINKGMKEKIKKGAKAAGLLLIGIGIGIVGAAVRSYMRGVDPEGYTRDIMYYYDPNPEYPEVKASIEARNKTRDGRHTIASTILLTETGAKCLRDYLIEDFGDDLEK